MLTAITQMNEFICCFQQPSQAIDTQFTTNARIEENRVIKSLMKVVLFCSQQGLLLRRHRDNKVTWAQQNETLGEEIHEHLYCIYTGTAKLTWASTV